MASFSTPPKSPQDNDAQFPNPPGDSISSIAVNGNKQSPSTILVSGSWDNAVNCYEISYGNSMGGATSVTNIVARSQMKHDMPVLSVALNTDGATSYSGGCDGKLRMWNVAQPATSAQVIGQHDAPIRVVKYLDQNNVVVTGSWDKTVKVWDCRQPNPVAQTTFNERVHCMDANNQAMVVGTADKMIHVFNLASGLQKVSEFKSPMDKYQTRCVSLFADGQGFAIGSVEGRVAIELFSEMSRKNQPTVTNQKYSSFIFKCQRDKRNDHGSNVYSVNAIAFHNLNTFCTAGSDGVFCFWDKVARHRLRALEKHKGRCPITSICYSPNGSMLFYAMSYDWSRGAENNNANYGNNIYAHVLQDDEVKPKGK